MNKKIKMILIFLIILFILIFSTFMITKIVKNNIMEKEKYGANSGSSSTSLIASNLKKGITIAGITGELEILDTTDATATENDILLGKTGYVNDKKITGILDVAYPTISYEPNGNTTWSKTQTVKISVSDDKTSTGNIVVKYVWSTSDSVPDFTSAKTISNGGSVTINTGTGIYYLYVQATDSAGNSSISKSKGFYIDNTKPVISDVSIRYKQFFNNNYVTSLVNYTEDSEPAHLLTTATGDPQIEIYDVSGFKNIKEIYLNVLTLNKNCEVQVFYAKAGENYTEANSKTAYLYGHDSFQEILVDIPDGNYQKIRVDIGKEAGLTYEVGTIDIIADENAENSSYVRMNFNNVIEDSGISKIQYSKDKTNWYDCEANGTIVTYYSSAENGTYYYRVIDKAGNISDATKGYVVNIQE